jgi:trans-AT polyketide synthase, acyltransferase and oxidoreductase domains
MLTITATMTGGATSHRDELGAVGHWAPDGAATVAFAPAEVAEIARQPRLAVHIVHEGPGGRVGAATGGRLVDGPGAGLTVPLLATLPPLYPEWLGDRSFCEVHGVRFAYVCGEMANGIATTGMVATMAGAEMLGFFGSAGLSPARTAGAVAELARTVPPGRAWGVNLIHSPNEPALEDRTAELVVRAGVPCVSASAFMELSPAVVYCSAAGLRVDPTGHPLRARHVFAKVSRPEVAERFMSPPPAGLVAALVAQGRLTQQEADIAATLPVAEDVTVEADSGGHTDNRPLTVLLPAMLQLRAQVSSRHRQYPRIRIGAAGGLGDPNSVAAAFALGADYVLTGSVNQACMESGLSEDGKAMLREADFVDVAMAPSADMFEFGVKVQVLKRGTMYASRASLLYDVYKRHESLEAIPGDLRCRLENEIFRQPLEGAWAETRAFWSEREPAQVEKAERAAKHQMALTFRWYLGMSSRWATAGSADRRPDYQIWCGPAMGAFNRWAAGSFLADSHRRSVVQVARNLMEGAAVVSRAHQLRTHGAEVLPSAFHFVPRPLI